MAAPRRVDAGELTVEEILAELTDGRRLLVSVDLLAELTDGRRLLVSVDLLGSPREISLRYDGEIYRRSRPSASGSYENQRFS